MIIIGLCGGSGAGKGTVADCFMKHGIPSVDTDAVYRELTTRGSSLLLELADAFGSDILTEEGDLNRKRLAQIVFSDSEKHKLLNSITHKKILQEAEVRFKRYADEGIPAAICDAPLLFESGFYKKCNVIIAVTAPTERRIARLVKRDGISEEAARQRISSQLSDEYLTEHSDHVIVNDGDVSQLQMQINKLVNIILK